MTKIAYNEYVEILDSLEKVRMTAIAALHQLSTDIANFQGNSELDGQAWGYAKDYMGHYETVVTAIENAINELSDALATYTNTFATQVGTAENRLDSEKMGELEERLRELQTRQDNLTESLAVLLKDASKISQLLGLNENSMLGVMTEIKLLKQYIAFEESQATVFSQALSTFESAIRVLGELANPVNFNPTTGQYKPFKSSEDYQNLVEYNKLFTEDRIDVQFEEIYEGADGEVIIPKVYVNGVYNEELTSLYNKNLTKAQWQMIKGLSVEVVKAWLSINEIETILDSKSTGLQKSEASFWLLFSLLPPDKIKDLNKASKILKQGGNIDDVKDLLKMTKEEAKIIKEAENLRDVEKASGADIPKPNVGVVQSRINVAENPTRFSPSKNAGQFTIPETDLKNILQSKPVIKTPVKQIESGGFERVVDVGRNIGTVKPSLGGETTTWIKIITDKAGNIITTYPIPKP